MGKPAVMKAWVLRAAFVAALAGTVPHILHQDPQDPHALLQKAGEVFGRAGYHTELIVDQAWGRSARAAEAALVARSALCGADVRVRALSISNLADDFQSATVQPGTSYAFGDWAGPQVERLGLMLALARLRLRSAFSFGRTPWARTAMLVIDDPSACLAILPLDLGDVWRKD